MKIGRTIIKGLENNSNADLIIGFLKQVKERTTLKFPNVIEFRKLRSAGRAYFRYEYTRISIAKELAFDDIVFTLIHELAHTSGHFNHKRAFWRKFFNNCLKMNLKVSNKYIQYKSGLRYFKKLNERGLV